MDDEQDDDQAALPPDPLPVCPVCSREYEPDPRSTGFTEDGEPYVCPPCAVKALRQYGWIP